jgi:hypothetical protein
MSDALIKVNNIDNSLESYLKSLDFNLDSSIQEMNRLERNTLYWQMYKGKHWDESEQDQDQPTPVFNKTKIIINKIITHLVGKPFTVNYPNEYIETLLAPFVNLILEESGGVETLGFEIAQTGSVTGDAFIKAAFSSETNSVRLILLDSSDCFVSYKFYNYKNNIPNDALLRWQFFDEEGKLTWKKERWNNDVVITTIGDEQIVREESGQNILGKVPIVHIRNQIVGKEAYGLSDISDLEPLNRLLNSRLRRFNDDVDYCGDPVTIIYGAKLGNLEKGANKTWAGLPVDSKVENLTLETDLPAQQKMIEYLSEGIHQVGNVPEDSVNGKKHISNVSGSSQQFDQLPIIEAVLRKRIVYGRGIKSAIELGLELLEICDRKYNLGLELSKVKKEITAYNKKSKDPFIRLKNWNCVDIQFQETFPKNQISFLQELQMEINMGVESRKGAMKRLGKNNIDLLVKEIEAENNTKVEIKTNTNEIKSELEKSSSVYDKDENELEDEIEKQEDSKK